MARVRESSAWSGRHTANIEPTPSLVVVTDGPPVTRLNRDGFVMDSYVTSYDDSEYAAWALAEASMIEYDAEPDWIDEIVPQCRVELHGPSDKRQQREDERTEFQSSITEMRDGDEDEDDDTNESLSSLPDDRNAKRRRPNA